MPGLHLRRNAISSAVAEFSLSEGDGLGGGGSLELLATLWFVLSATSLELEVAVVPLDSG